MNPKTRQRAMRSFLAALLQSDLSLGEIQDIADNLYFGAFGRDVGDFLRNAMNTISEANTDKAKLLPDEPSVRSIYETMARRRLPKKAVIQLMTLAAPRIKASQFPVNSSILEILEKFMDLANPAEVRSLLSILEGEPADAYLKGISRRNRDK